MRYELQKVVGDRRLRLLLALIVLANAWLFYDHCTDDSQGFTMAQVQVKYQEDLETLRNEQEALRNRILTDAEDEDGTLVTGSVFHELLLDNAAVARMEESEGYAEYRQGMIQESQIKLKLGLLGSAGSFSALSLERGVKEYSALEAVTPITAFYGGVELFAGWHASDVLLLAFCFAPALLLLTYETGAGLDKLTRPARFGHLRLYLRKYGAAVVLASAGFALLYGANGLVAMGLFDCGSLSAPVQSVYGYHGCQWNLSVAEFLVCLMLLKYLWALGCVTLSFFLCTLTGSSAAAVTAAIACGAAALLLRGSRLLWLRCVSLCQLAGAEALFQGAIYLNFFGRPIQRIPAAVLFVVLLGMAALAGGAAFFCRTPRGSGLPFRLPFQRRLVRRHTRLLVFEGRKVFLLCRGAAVLLLLLAVQLTSYRNFGVINTVYEHYYRNYSSVLAGEPNDEKDAYLESEAARFQELHDKLNEYAAVYGDIAAYPSDAAGMQSELLAESPFQEARRQYENLTEGQVYLYQTGYERLLGIEGQRDDLRNLALFLLALVLVLPAVFAVDAESGVQVLQITAGRQGAVLGRKILWSVVLLLLVAVTAFLPQYLAVFGAYGGPALSAQANSVNLLFQVPSSWTIGGYFAAVNLGRLLLGCAAGGVTAVISAKARNTAIGIIISLALVLLPIGLAFLLLL